MNNIMNKKKCHAGVKNSSHQFRYFMYMILTEQSYFFWVWGFCSVCFFFETGSQCVVLVGPKHSMYQAGLKCPDILLPLPPKCSH